MTELVALGARVQVHVEASDAAMPPEGGLPERVLHELDELQHAGLIVAGEASA